MQEGRREEVLCIVSGEKNYAIQFEYIQEICREVKLSVMPCLPEYFCGVYNYKGSMVPVAELAKGVGGAREHREGWILIVIRCGRYQFGILLPESTELLLGEGAEKVESPSEYADASGVWKQKAVIRHEGRLFAVIDVERTADGMVIHK